MRRKDAPPGTPNFGLDAHHSSVINFELERLAPKDRVKAHKAILDYMNGKMKARPAGNHAGSLRRAIREMTHPID